MAKSKKKRDLKVTYRSTAEPKADAGGVPVFCSFDELADPRDIVGNPRNPNSHPEEQIELLAHIIQSQGWRAPITVSKRSGYVVRGHGRLSAALLFGAKSVPIDYQDYANEAEEWADLIADNRLAELSSVEDAKISELLAEIELGSVPVILSGYDEEEVDKLLEQMAGEGGPGVPDGADDVPEVPVNPFSKPGDIWILGEHRLMCGDATDPKSVAMLMDGVKAHCVFTDPPYGVSYTGGGGIKDKEWNMIENDGYSGDALASNLLKPSFQNMVASTIEDAAFYIWHATVTAKEFYESMLSAGLVERQQIVWVKNNFHLGPKDYHIGHEPCFYAQKKGRRANFYGDRKNQTVWRVESRSSVDTSVTITGGVLITDADGHSVFIDAKAPKGKKVRRVDMSNPVSVSNADGSTAWEIDREVGIEHPTQKPVALAIRALENSTKPGEIVLDLFGGSGTTMIGAQISGRKARLMELDPKYVDVSVERYVRIAGDGGAKVIRDGKVIPYAEIASAMSAPEE